MKPKLPMAGEILPYLEKIDAHRWYSNWGPLVTRLEEQLADHFGLDCACAVTTASCTAGLTAALLARAVPRGSLSIMPSWTFAATPHAAQAAGLTPWFFDVDPHTWALDAHQIREAAARGSRRPGAVIVVSPFGAPVDIRAWEAFEDDTGVAVIIDAAAGFDSVQPSKIPCVVNLHATKILGAGEGGFIATTDSRLADRIRACCNFGFQDSRTAMHPAVNAKMSEYHAAVALASLATWPSTREEHLRIAQWYRDALARVRGIELQPGFGLEWISSTTNVLLPPDSAAEIPQFLRESGIETRSWWGAGCHKQPAFRDCQRRPLPVTEGLGGRVLGLPHFPGLQQREVETVAGALAESLVSGALHQLSGALMEGTREHACKASLNSQASKIMSSVE